MTPAVERALAAAQVHARALGADQVHPEHLLRGLLEEDEGHPAAMLRRAGLDLAAVRAAFALASPAAPGAELPLAPPARRLLQHAAQVASEQLLESSLPSQAFLMALVRHDEDLRMFLTGHGLDVALLEQHFTAQLPPPLTLEEPLRLTDPSERVDTARVLDASANRAREALRAIEDYTRFVLDDAFLSGELKQLRHALADALGHLPAAMLLEGRDTLRDVGTEITTDAEQARYSLDHVVQANFKRLEEALRSLEEFGKLITPDLGRAVEALRYRVYTLEKAIILGSAARKRLEECRLCVLLTGSLCTAALDWTIAEAAAGGADLFQLREKKLSDRELLERARNVRRWTRKAGVLFIVNDRPDIARLCEADGVHLGQDDMPVKEARRILGPDAIIGVSTHDLDQVRQAVLDGAGYIGVGPTFPSQTKDFAELAGLEFVRRATEETTLPAFAIGGIHAGNVRAVVAAGARRIAVSQAIGQADEPRDVAAELRRMLASGAASG